MRNAVTSVFAIIIAAGLSPAGPSFEAAAQPAAAHFGNPLSAPQGTMPQGSPQSKNQVPRNVKVVEADGHGASEIQARKAAVSAAVEQAVGVFIDSRRRSEMSLTDDKLHEIVEEKVQTYSSAFVDKVETVSAGPDPLGGYSVRVRAQVEIPDLIAAMKAADLPITPVDVASNQARLDTQSQMLEDASDLITSKLRDLPGVFNAEVNAQSVSATLDPLENSLAALKGEITFSFDRAGVDRLRQAYNALQSLVVNIPNANSAPGYQTEDFQSFDLGRPLNFYVCQSNQLGQANCHGEHLQQRKVLEAFKGLSITFDLLTGQDVIGRVSEPIRVGCVPPGTVSSYPGYLEAPQERSMPDNLWVGSNNMHRQTDENVLWKSAARSLRTEPATLRVTSAPVLDVHDTVPYPATGGATRYTPPPAPHGICLMLMAWDDLRLVIPQSPMPIRRNFYLVGPRNLIERVDGLRASVTMR